MKKTWKSTLMLPLLAALSIGFAAGCGSDTTNTVAPAGGLVYAVTSANQLLIFTGQNNNSSGTSNPSVALNLPVSGAVAVDIDRGRDRLYITCDGGSVAGSGRLLIYNNASRINSGSVADANIGLAAGVPIDASYDDTRDILYIGDRNGLIATLRSASTATSASTVAFSQVSAGTVITTLNSVLADQAGDRLITAAGTTNAAILTLPVFNNASTTLTSAGSLNPAGLTNALDLHFENNNLLVLDGANFGAANTRVLRYAAPFGGVSPNQTFAIPNGVCLRYDGGQDSLYVGQSTNVISVINQANTQTNPVISRTLNTNAGTNDVTVDNTRS